MAKHCDNREWILRNERLMAAYTRAGYSPAEAMARTSDIRMKYENDKGWAEGCTAMGIAFGISGLILGAILRHSANASLTKAVEMENQIVGNRFKETAMRHALSETMNSLEEMRKKNEEAKNDEDNKDKEENAKSENREENKE